MDTAIAQLQHRRKTLPEHAEIARPARCAAGRSRRVRQRLARNQQRIADGTVGDPKALALMIDEVEHLKRRISDLEDAELEIMEQLETEVAGRDTLTGQAARLDEVLAGLSAKRDTQLAELDADIVERRTERATLTPQVPAPLLTLYDKVGASHGGVGAAELRQRRCTGCQLELNAADLREYAAAPADEVLRCEECSRILIRTEQSGL